MNEKYKQDFLRAGALAKETRAFGKALIVKGASYNETITQILQKIEGLGARPAFPPQIALDDVAAHFLPDPGQDIVFSNQVVKLDVGVCYNGAIGDCAVTVDLSGKNQHLVDAAEAALSAAEKIIRVGLPVREIGRAIEQAIASFGLQPIRNLSGHGLGYNKVHTSPNIPNYYDKSTAVIKPGMTFAIEPFATDGKGSIFETPHAAIFSCPSPPPKLPGLPGQVLEKIKTFQGLPFSIHDLIRSGFSFIEVKIVLAELVKKNILIGYGPLIEEGHGKVAQAENSVLVDEKGAVFITTR